MEQYLKPAYYVDSEHPEVQAFAKKVIGDTLDPKAQAIKLYYAVRDGWRYNPYQVILEPKEVLKASYLFTKNDGYCIEKACLLAAAARAVGIPSRLGFSDVRNHIGTEKLQERLRTDVMVFHGYTELYINDKWVKCTPAFNKELCEYLNVAPLEFNGEEDSIFQEYHNGGGLFMEYLDEHGVFDDVPFDAFVAALKKHYPHLFGL